MASVALGFMAATRALNSGSAIKSGLLVGGQGVGR
jgi:hypothetical protein